MSRKRTLITLPFNLILDGKIPANAKIVYAVLKSSLVGKPKPGRKNSVKIAKRDIIEKSGLSLHTVTKSIKILKRIGWIRPEKIWGSASEYFFTNPE